MLLQTWSVHTQTVWKTTSVLTSQKLAKERPVCAAEMPNGFETVSVISEVTNEIGDGGCDPLAKAECAYVATYSSEEV